MTDTRHSHPRKCDRTSDDGEVQRMWVQGACTSWGWPWILTPVRDEPCLHRVRRQMLLLREWASHAPAQSDSPHAPISSCLCFAPSRPPYHPPPSVRSSCHLPFACLASRPRDPRISESLGGMCDVPLMILWVYQVCHRTSDRPPPPPRGGGLQGAGEVWHRKDMDLWSVTNHKMKWRWGSSHLAAPVGKQHPREAHTNTRRQRRQRKFFQGAEADLHCDTMVHFRGAIPPPPPRGGTVTL